MLYSSFVSVTLSDQLDNNISDNTTVISPNAMQAPIYMYK